MVNRVEKSQIDQRSRKNSKMINIVRKSQHINKGRKSQKINRVGKSQKDCLLCRWSQLNIQRNCNNVELLSLLLHTKQIQGILVLLLQFMAAHPHYPKILPLVLLFPLDDLDLPVQWCPNSQATKSPWSQCGSQKEFVTGRPAFILNQCSAA